jgi:hypothetical protein
LTHEREFGDLKKLPHAGTAQLKENKQGSAVHLLPFFLRSTMDKKWNIEDRRGM